MKKLLQIEFIKYSRSSLFYIFAGLFIALVILSEASNIFLLSKFHAKLSFPSAWSDMLYAAGSMNFFVGLMVLISITNEYQFRTFRQHIVDSLDKKDIFLAKFLYALLLTVMAVVFVAITVVAAGFITADKHDFGNGAQLLGRYFVQLLGYISIAIFFAFLLRGTAQAVIVYVFYIPIESLIGALLVNFAHVNASVPKYFPKTLFSDLIESGMIKLVQNAAKAKIPQSGPDEQTTLILGIVYILLLLACSFWLLKKRDI